MSVRRLRVLLVTGLDKPWNNGWYYKAGLEKNGHEVLLFDPASVTNPAERAVELTKGFKPDFLLHTKRELPAEVFQELRRLTVVVQWYPDSVVPDWLPPYVRASDVFFTMSEGLVEEFKSQNPCTFWLTQAFEPSFFDIEGVTTEDIRVFSADVAFVGNLGSKPDYIVRRRYIRRVIDEGFKLKWWGPRIPLKLSTLPLITGKVGRAYGGRFVWGKEYAKVARLSKVFLAFDVRPDIRKSMSARMYTAVGCGAFYMCRHVDGIEEVLEPGKEIVTFRSEEEMTELIRYYLGEESIRRRIAAAGRERVLREHTYEIRMRQLIGMIEELL